MGDRSIKNGVWTVELKCNANPTDLWREFDDLVYDCMKRCEKKEESICWRGQPDDKPMISLFDRTLGEAGTVDTSDRLKRLGDHRQFCAYAFRGVLRNPSVRELKQAIREGHLNENHFWAIGQHYDLATPLLDWSLSPFVAAFFAFEQERAVTEARFEKESKTWFDERLTRELKKRRREKGNTPAHFGRDMAALIEDLKQRLFPGHRYVYGLKYQELAKMAENDEHYKKELSDFDERFRRWKPTQKDRWDVYHREKDKPPMRPVPRFQYFDPLSSEHVRLLNQKGIFTITSDGASVEECVKTYYPKHNKSWILIQIALPNEKREEFLGHLNWMNINRLSLFPDLLGASKYSNQEIARGSARRQR